MRVPVVLALVAAAASAQSGLITSAAQLQATLGDKLLLEDFEGFSLAGGTSAAAPNPLSAITKPQWHLLSGVTYSSLHSLGVYTGQLLGEDSNILAGVGSSTNDVTIAFDAPQLAVGFYLVDITGNLDYHETITFLRGATVLGSTNLVVPSAGAQFLGWQDAGGITSARVTSDSFAMVDDVMWGVTAAPVVWTGLGSGLAGIGGVPSLAGAGTLAAGSPGSLSLASAKPSAPALLFVSLASSPVPFKGGTLVAFPFLVTVPLVTSAGGALVLPFTWPAGVPSATSLVFQDAIQDAAAVHGVALSNALKGVTP
jgi:hypothetical protein